MTCRWRQLPGRIPSKEELAARIAQLERCLDAGGCTLLERSELAEGLGGLLKRALQLSAMSRADALDVSMQVGAHSKHHHIEHGCNVSHFMHGG